MLSYFDLGTSLEFLEFERYKGANISVVKLFESNHFVYKLWSNVRSVSSSPLPISPSIQDYTVELLLSFCSLRDFICWGLCWFSPTIHFSVVTRGMYIFGKNGVACCLLRIDLCLDIRPWRFLLVRRVEPWSKRQNEVACSQVSVSCPESEVSISSFVSMIFVLVLLPKRVYYLYHFILFFANYLEFQLF